MAITTAAITERIKRLEALTLALGREGAILKEGRGPRIAGEHRAYLEKIQDAIAGLVDARTVLVEGLRRRRRLEYGD